ncbi:MAG: CDP-diacylglycerol--serine O-phosphatidyltransferase [Proteobacteria bacterium]|nr:CDP-diacylglycerol--serine O-phosphatidyltransferase [Pseudomonadota bacterium]
MSGVKHRRLPGLTVNRLIPNALTLLGLCAGMTAIRLALMERWDLAIAAVLVAMVADVLDGRIARLMGATSEFGAQLDSLADVINFGVTPALMVYLWALSGTGGLGWALILVFAMCCAMRLARFNAALGIDEPAPPWASRFFTGVPAPCGAGLVLLPMVLSFELGEDILASPVLNGVMLVVVSALMVSKVPTFSAKRIRMRQSYVGLVLVGVGAFAAFLVSTPWVTLSLVGIAYMASIPISVSVHRRLRAGRPVKERARDEDSAA